MKGICQPRVWHPFHLCSCIVLSVNGAKNRKFFLIISAQQNLKQFTNYLNIY